MKPPDAWVKLLESCGKNRYEEPEFRMVWGPERMEWRGGNHADFDANGTLLRRKAEMRLVPKYGTKPHWILERWLSPELYGTPENWRIQNLDMETGLLILGPYPSRGEYESCFRFADVDTDNPIHPTEEMIRCLVWMIRETQGMSEKLKRSAMFAAHERSEKAYKSKVRDIFQEAKEDVDLAIGRRPSRLLDVKYDVEANVAPNKGLVQIGSSQGEIN